MSQALATIKPVVPRAEGLQLQTLDDIIRLGNAFARSGYFADARDASQCVAKIIAGAELGFGPMASMTGIHVIQGKPTMSANLIAAAIKRSGKYNFKVLDLTPERCEIEFYEMGEVLTPTSAFSIDDARKAGLITGGNKGSWEKYRRNMLFARALSNGAKWHCADVFGGLVYVPEEMGAIVDGDTGTVLEVKATPVNKAQEFNGADEPENQPVETKDDGWQIEEHTRIRIFDLCAELEKLKVKEETWRKRMKEVTGVSSRKSLTGPQAAALMKAFAVWIADIKSIDEPDSKPVAGPTREELQKEIEKLVRTLVNDYGVTFNAIKAESKKLTGIEKRTELNYEQSVTVSNALDEWVKRMKAQAEKDEAEERAAIQAEGGAK